jgi:hypothetical protein
MRALHSLPRPGAVGELAIVVGIYRGHLPNLRTLFAYAVGIVFIWRTP